MKIWLLATRPQFLTAIIVPVLLGTAMAWASTQQLQLTLFFIALVAAVLCHAGANVLNDYYDHLNQADELNKDPLSPFAGGSRMIQRQLLSPRQMAIYGWSLMGIGCVLGLLLVGLTGWGLLIIGFIGVSTGVLYSMPPLALHSRALGELFVGINFGLLTVLGAYYVQTETVSWLAVYAALPVALLVSAILYINGFPDCETDQQAGKQTLVVYLGKQRASQFFILFPVLSFALIGLGLAIGWLPEGCAFAFLAMPFAVQAVRVSHEHFAQKHALLPAMKSTILLHLIVSLGLTLGFSLA